MDYYWYQHIQSKTLANIFLSLSQQIRLRSSAAEDESFARKLLTEIDRDMFIDELKSLSQMVKIYSKITRTAQEEPGRVCVCEVTVVCEKKELVVKLKVRLISLFVKLKFEIIIFMY